MDWGVRGSKRPSGGPVRAQERPCTGYDPHILWATGLVSRHVVAENKRGPRGAPGVRLQDRRGSARAIHRNSALAPAVPGGNGMTFSRRSEPPGACARCAHPRWRPRSGIRAAQTGRPAESHLRARLRASTGRGFTHIVAVAERSLRLAEKPCRARRNVRATAEVRLAPIGSIGNIALYPSHDT